LGLKLVPALLSMVAGSTDAISFLGLGGLFVAHITGSLIILAAHLVTGARVHVAAVLSVPVFILALILTRVLVARLEAVGIESLRPLLVVQLVLLVGFLTIAVVANARVDPNAPPAVVAAMLGVSAMGARNALVQVSVRGLPSTAVMTTNITRFTMDVGDVLLGKVRPRSTLLAGGHPTPGRRSSASRPEPLWALASTRALASLPWRFPPALGSSR
jgi:uncharacterized membrane protein YoaK (UPF0700 family)